MTRGELIRLVGRRLRDDSQSLYSTALLHDGFRLGQDRIKQEVPILRVMPYLTDDDLEIEYLPEPYHSMLADMAVYHAFAMDERSYESNLAQNTFEGKLEQLKDEIESGSITIVDGDGNEVLAPPSGATGTVLNVYFRNDHYDTTNDGRFATDDRIDYNTTGDGEVVVG